MKSRSCSMDCDPLTAKGCGTGQNCDLALKPDRSRLYTDCIKAGAGDHLAPCTVAQECKAGFSCLKIQQGGGPIQQVCLQACVRAPTPSACPNNRVCQPIDPPNTLGGKEWGWCY
jgi:hypothetical protein